MCKSVSDVDHTKEKIKEKMAGLCKIKDPKMNETIVKIVGDIDRDMAESEIVERLKKTK